MTTFTIHAEPVMADALRRAAAKSDLSINRYILRVLGTSLGLVKAKRSQTPPFLDIPKTISKADADRLLSAQDAFSQIDGEEWR